MNITRTTTAAFLMVGMLLAATIAARAQRQMENLSRGVVAIQQADGKVFVSWRLLGTDPENIAFNLYRKSEGGAGRMGGPRGGGLPPTGPRG